MRYFQSIMCLVGIFLNYEISTAFADPITVATWNIEQLRAEIGVGVRSEEDYARLAGYANQLNADIIALQEVDGDTAAEKVFDPDVYQFFFSSRNHTQRTGFAVRKSLPARQLPDVTALNVSGGLRHGVDIEVTLEGETRKTALHPSQVTLLGSGPHTQ